MPLECVEVAIADVLKNHRILLTASSLLQNTVHATLFDQYVKWSEIVGIRHDTELRANVHCGVVLSTTPTA